MEHIGAIFGADIIPLFTESCFRFYKLCRAWVTDVKKNKQANIEKLKFEESDVMVEMLRSLEQDLGVHVSLEEADLMYLMCNFDLAWDPATIR